MIVLRNFDKANQYLNLSFYRLENGYTGRTNGWYKYNDETLFALFVDNFSLKILFNHQVFDVPDDYYVVLEDKDSSGYRKIKLYKKPDDLILEFKYIVPDSSLDQAPFDYIDDEDFDWGLFLESIINNKLRRSTFISQNT